MPSARERKIVPELHEYRLIQMEGLPVISYLSRGHILLGKAGQISNGVPRQKPGQKEVQNDHDQEAHQCQNQVFTILFTGVPPCVQKIISW